MTISHNGNLIKKIYHNGHYIKEVYHGNSLVWKNNTVETNLFILNGGYGVHQTYLGWFSPDIFNSYYTGNFEDLVRTAIMPCQPNTTYRISMYVNKRLRLSSHNIIPSISPNIAITQMNTTLITEYQAAGTYSKNVILDYTTGPADNYLFIYYWLDTDGNNPEICYDTINVIKVL